MKYFLIAGERSGDLHGSNLIKSLKKIDSEAEISCWGGEQMEKSGAKLLMHYREMAVMGIWEVFLKLFTILSFLDQCEEDIINFEPDVVILIDFGGFNLRLARKLHKKNIKVHYYISPKIWAWNSSRAKKIRKYVDKMYCILPFEKDFYKKYDMEVDYVGNPVVDAVNAFTPSSIFLRHHDLKSGYIALLPGSRKQEVSKLLPLMLEVADHFKEKTFIVAGVKNLPSEVYDGCKWRTNVVLIFEENYNILTHAGAAIVTSGTATLETGLFEVPQVVAYITSPLTYFIGSRLVKLEHFSLVNLIAGQEVVKELLQDNCNFETLITSFNEMMKPRNYHKIKNGYQQIKSILGDENASDKTARLILEYLNQA